MHGTILYREPDKKEYRSGINTKDNEVNVVLGQAEDRMVLLLVSFSDVELCRTNFLEFPMAAM